MKNKRKKKTTAPRVRLPRNYKLHPLVRGVRRLMRTDGVSMRQIALQRLGITQQSLHEWMVQAKKNRDFELSPQRVVQLCKMTGQEPHDFNPELWKKGWRF